MIDNKQATDNCTRLLAGYIKEKGISMASISKGTGISYDKLCRSLSARIRPFRADELLKVCNFLEIDPMRFYRPKIMDDKGQSWVR